MSALYSSESEEWGTPDWLFNRLHQRFSFRLDVCATAENAKCEHFFTKEQDALQHHWRNQNCWMNPPYGRNIGDWVRKAFYESFQKTVVCLLPASTDAAWWHAYVMRYADEVMFIKGRVKFKGKGCGRSTFASVIVVFAPDYLDDKPRLPKFSSMDQKQ